MHRSYVYEYDVSIHNILVNIGKNLPKVYIKNGQKEKEE